MPYFYFQALVDVHEYLIKITLIYIILNAAPQFTNTFFWLAVPWTEGGLLCSKTELCTWNNVVTASHSLLCAKTWMHTKNSSGLWSKTDVLSFVLNIIHMLLNKNHSQSSCSLPAVTSRVFLIMRGQVTHSQQDACQLFSYR